MPIYSFSYTFAMSAWIRQAPEARGMPQARLAEILGVTPSAAAQLERSEERDTIKVASLESALRALGLDLRLSVAPHREPLGPNPDAVVEATREALRAGDDIAALRYITAGAHYAAQHPDEAEWLRLEQRPATLGSRRWDTLLRGVYRYYLGDRAPQWARTAPRLSRPWYPAAIIPTLQHRAEATTPPELRALNILIDEQSLRRA